MRVADEDNELRAAAFAFLTDLCSRTGGLVRREDLRRFTFRGRTISLEQHMRGIRVVEGHPAALTILTTYAARPQDRPYEDDIGPDLYPRYMWQGENPAAADNVALRTAMELSKPLAWFRAIEQGLYEAIYPVWVVDEEPEKRRFVIALDEVMRSSWQPDVLLSPPDIARSMEYNLQLVRRRLHQPDFRRRVLVAYRQQCALCRLRHVELLDAAHIQEDSEGGQPVVTNGIAMCAIHHRAFDAQVLGIRPNYVIEVRRDVREEQDGPTLQHALQGMHRQSLTLPRPKAAWPNTELLEERFERFLKAS